MTTRDRTRLIGVHPDLIAIIDEVFLDMEEADAPMFVIEGLRTLRRQQELYAHGRTDLMRIVTYKDGVRHISNHQAHADGLGHAADCAFISENPFSLDHPWEKYGEALEARGAFWGGRWKMADMPHAELPEAPDKMDERTVFA